MSDFRSVFIIFVFMGLCIFSLFGVYSLEKFNEERLRVAAEVAINTPPQTFENHSLDTTETIVKSSYATILGIVVSGNATQAAIADNTVSVVWGIVVIIALCIFGTIYFMSKKKQDPRYVSHRPDGTFYG